MIDQEELTWNNMMNGVVKMRLKMLTMNGKIHSHEMDLLMMEGKTNHCGSDIDDDHFEFDYFSWSKFVNVDNRI